MRHLFWFRGKKMCRSFIIPKRINGDCDLRIMCTATLSALIIPIAGGLHEDFVMSKIDASALTSLEARGVHTASRTDTQQIAAFSAMKPQIAAVMADVLGLIPPVCALMDGPAPIATKILPPIKVCQAIHLAYSLRRKSAAPAFGPTAVNPYLSHSENLHRYHP